MNPITIDWELVQNIFNVLSPIGVGLWAIYTFILKKPDNDQSVIQKLLANQETLTTENSTLREEIIVLRREVEQFEAGYYEQVTIFKIDKSPKIAVQSLRPLKTTEALKRIMRAGVVKESS